MIISLTTFKSARTVGETTKWLKEALERYGKSKPTSLCSAEVPPPR